MKIRITACLSRVKSARNRKQYLATALSLFAVCLTGCGYSGFPLGPGTPPPVVPSDIGNWQIQASSTAGTSPFSALAGWIYEPTNTTNAANVTTQSVFQATPDKSNCYVGATTLPSQGTLTGTALVLNGFSVNGQYVVINATQDATATHLTGTYSVRGGCAGGATGALTGTRYSALTGTYKGALTGGQTFTLTTTQDKYPTGTGFFPLSGSATVTGTACLASASIDATSSYVIGSTVSLTLVAPNQLKLVLLGSFAADAGTITVISVTKTAGQCNDSFSGGTFVRQ